MPRRSTGPAASAATLSASRLAASLGPARVEPAGADDGASAPQGLLDMGGGQDFSFRGGAVAGSSPPASAGNVPARLRWRLGLRAAVLLGVLAMVAGGWFWWRVATAVPEVTPLMAVTETGTADGGAGTIPREDETGTAGSGGDSGQPESGGDATDDFGGNAVVHVAGAVKKAGVVKLSKGSRVHDAIVAAGGGTAAADLNRLNLAAVLEDGQKIYVPLRGEAAQQEAAASGGQPEGSPPAGAGTGVAGPGAAGSGSGVTGGGSSTSGAKVNLNTATAEELDALPRVGPVLAQRIVDWRAEHGNFKAVEELDAVDGVGPKMMEALQPLVTV